MSLEMSSVAERSEKTLLLFIEDNDMDFEFAKRAFRIAKLKAKIKRFDMGEPVLDFIEQIKTGDVAVSKIPRLIFLDLTLPDIPGQEILRSIRACAPIKEVPVIILTGRGDQKGVDELYKMGANSYLVKPMNLDDLSVYFNVIREYWFGLSKLPGVKMPIKTG